MTVYADVQRLEPGAEVELFALNASSITGSNADNLYFHGYTQVGSITWQGVVYQPWPIEASGFVMDPQQPPVPTLSVGNVDGSITALCLNYQDLVGALLTRHRTFAQYLDAVNAPVSQAVAQPFSPNGVTFQLEGTSNQVANLEVSAIHRTDWQGRQLLYSTHRTNLCLYSNAVGTVPWGVTQAGAATAPVITGNYAQAPDGTMTASRVQMSLNGGSTSSDYCQLLQNQTTPSGAVVTESIWLKSNTGANQTIIIRDDKAPATGNKLIVLTTTWQNFFFTSTHTGVTSSTLKLWLRGASGSDSTADFLAWGGQIEVNASTTSLIKTTTVAVTVTDYTLSGTTGTLGQLPSTGATYDWDGTYQFNPSADPTQEFPPDSWYLERKSSETNEAVTWELSSALDFGTQQLPGRQIIANLCTWLQRGGYRGPYCGYTGGPVAKADDTPTTDPTLDACGGRLSSCNLRFGTGNPLPYGGYPAAGLLRT